MHNCISWNFIRRINSTRISKVIFFQGRYFTKQFKTAEYTRLSLNEIRKNYIRAWKKDHLPTLWFFRTSFYKYYYVAIVPGPCAIAGTPEPVDFNKYWLRLSDYILATNAYTVLMLNFLLQRVLKHKNKT